VSVELSALVTVYADRFAAIARRDQEGKRIVALRGDDSSPSHFVTVGSISTASFVV